MKILGTPVGSAEFVESVIRDRLKKERELWQAIPKVHDLQCAWQFLLQCAGPRCHHFLRTVPLSQSRTYAEGHDQGMREVMVTLLKGLPGYGQQKAVRHQLASLPMRMGGLGLRSAVRTSPAAFWASWADSLSMIQTRLPEIADAVIRQMVAREATGCLAKLQESTRVLDLSGFVGRPQWADLRDGVRPPPTTVAEPGEWQHGWQYYASSSLEHHFRETVVPAQSSAADQAHLRSHAGPGASAVLCGAPTKPEFQLQPSGFRTAVLERMRLPLDLTEAHCECGGVIDSQGRHRAACPRSGRLRSRAVAPERTMARICREAGAIVRVNVKLRDMNATVSVQDEREVEVLASGLPLQHGSQLAVDVTLRCALTACGRARPNAATVDGAVADAARRDKETKYSELVDGQRCHLVVVAIETGGRWSSEAYNFVEYLARARSRETPHVLRRSAFRTWRRRWTRMLAVSCCKAFTGSFTSPRGDFAGVDGTTPDLADLFGEE